MTLEDYDDMYSPDLRPFFRMLWAVVAGLLLLLAAAVVYIAARWWVRNRIKR